MFPGNVYSNSNTRRCRLDIEEKKYNSYLNFAYELNMNMLSSLYLQLNLLMYFKR